MARRKTAQAAAVEANGSEGRISLDDMQDIIQKLEQMEFFEALTREFTGKVKSIAQELIDFRKDLQKRIEPSILSMASREIPEASQQLEGINETLESSTMKIMDINDAQMEITTTQLARLASLLSTSRGKNGSSEALRRQVEVLEKIRDLSMSMLEPLSFQDLVGQRIQRIIRLVKSMETRIEDLIISCGIKLQKHKENPEKRFEDLEKDVQHYRCELKGPQRKGEGLGQNDIDALLASM